MTSASNIHAQISGYALPKKLWEELLHQICISCLLHLIFTLCIMAKLLTTLPQEARLFSIYLFCGCCFPMHSALIGDGIKASSS